MLLNIAESGDANMQSRLMTKEKEFYRMMILLNDLSQDKNRMF